MNIITKTGTKPKISCLGLAFKPDVDDLRESKPLEIIKALLSAGYEISVVEPNIQSHSNLTLLSLSDAIKNPDIICVLVKHNEFLQPSIKEKLIECGALDFCSILD